MNISNLKRASDYEVNNWLIEELKLTPYQEELLCAGEIIRSSNFYIYKTDRDNKTSILWRLSLIPYLLYFIVMLCLLPFNFLFTGKWGYGRNFIDNFHSKWTKKLKLS